MIGRWSKWRHFPDPAKGDFIVAPFGPGCYRLRCLETRELVLFGMAGHVAHRMYSLHPKGPGTRKNKQKRTFVGKHLPRLQYQVIAFRSRKEAVECERDLRAQRHLYIFKT